MGSELKALPTGNGPPLDHSEHEDSPRSCPEKDQRPLLKPASSPSAVPAGADSLDELERKCAAYVRKDTYGTMGRGEIPLSEKVLLGFALVTLVPLRFILGIVLVLLYYVICRCCTMFVDKDSEAAEEGQGEYSGRLVGWRREVIVRSGSFLSRLMLFVMGFYWISETSVRTTDTQPEGSESERPGVVISNHVSYVDILYHMSAYFPSFVAKRSVAKLPLVGIISKCLGCVYVQRESKSSDSRGVGAVVMDRIQKAHDSELWPKVMIFPEGTTTNGDYLLPFKSGAFLAKVPVLPVILKYPYERFSPAWDSISGARHMILLLCQFVNYLEVTRLPIYYPSEEEKEDPKLYAENVRKWMALKGNLILTDIGLAEKRVYHAALNGNSLPRALHQKDD